MMHLENRNYGLSILISCLGIPLILWGLYDTRLVKKCTHQVNAVCVYCTLGRKGGVHPVFTYTYEGETYKATSQQSLSSGILVADKTYRIYIDPEKPTRNIIFPRLMKNNKDIIIGGAVMIIAGIGLLVATQLNLVSLF